jgi:hypothetical protein
MEEPFTPVGKVREMEPVFDEALKYAEAMARVVLTQGCLSKRNALMDIRREINRALSAHLVAAENP